jgi:hypothetical protein
MRFYILATSLLLMGCAGVQANSAASEEFFRLVESGDCQGAERIARNRFRGDVTYALIGINKMECEKDRKAGIEYLKMAARNGNSIATQLLIEIGETPPEPTRRVIIQNNNQTQAAPPIIIQQPAPVPSFGGCIQDGGTLFCPNHPATRGSSRTPYSR